MIAIQAPIIDVRHGVTMTSGGAEAVAASAPAWAGGLKGWLRRGRPRGSALIAKIERAKG